MLLSRCFLPLISGTWGKSTKTWLLEETSGGAVRQLWASCRWGAVTDCWTPPTMQGGGSIHHPHTQTCSKDTSHQIQVKSLRNPQCSGGSWRFSFIQYINSNKILSYTLVLCAKQVNKLIPALYSCRTRDTMRA